MTCSFHLNNFCAIVKIPSEPRAIGFSVSHSKTDNEYLSFILIANKISHYKRKRETVVTGVYNPFYYRENLFLKCWRIR